MFLFKKLLTPFLMPPGIFTVALLASGLYYFFKKKFRLAGLINFFLGFLLWLTAIVPVSDALVSGLESDFTLPLAPRGDVIILLGGGIYDDVADLSGTGAPTEEMLARIVTAVRLQKKLKIPIIVSTGQVYPWQKSEAPIDRRFLIDLGVPADKIILEEKSRDTIENARYSREICERFHFQKPLLITSALHMKRAVLSFTKVHLAVMPVPVNLEQRKTRSYVWMEFLPGNPERAWLALREYMGLAFYTAAY